MMESANVMEVSGCDVMFHWRGQQHPRVMHKDIPYPQAIRLLEMQERSWTASKPGRYSQRMGGFEVVLRFSDGKIAGSAWIETHPVRESSNRSA